jgi:hypothetical protein
MKSNIIILAVGLSGSSVLAGLIKRAGYSTGASTYVKPDYDTFENLELVQLNQRLLTRAGIGEKFAVEHRPEFAQRMLALRGVIDDTEFRDFIARCDATGPWLWKDPRLSITLYFWQYLLDFDRVKVIVNHREPVQAWISWTLRRQIQSFNYAKHFSDGVVSSVEHLLDARNQSYIRVCYEDLICQPQHTLYRINRFASLQLELEDLVAAYGGKLGQKTHGLGNFAKAALIYLKNYPERYA